MPMLTIFCKRFLLLFMALYINKSCSPQTRLVPKNQNKPLVIKNVDSYKNTTLLDTNKQMIALQGFLTTFYTEFKYATTDNFTKKILYTEPKAYLRAPAARALQKVVNALADSGLSIKIYDAYRPYRVTVKMWKIIPDARYAADPAKGSGHNRGAAIDLTLVDLETSTELEMPTKYDDFTEKAHHDYMQLATTILNNRALLKRVMERFGFVALPTEWWHYSLPDASRKFELMDLDFKQMKKVAVRIQ